MARPRTSPGDDAAVEAQIGEREGEAERVEEQAAEEAKASERRERQAERATERKSYPDGALPPTEKLTSGGETAYARDYLLANASALTGQPGHVLAGALFGNDQEYLTVREATQVAERWLEQPVATAES